MDIINAFPKGPQVGIAISALLLLPAFYIKYAILSVPPITDAVKAAGHSAILEAGLSRIPYQLGMYILFGFAFLTFCASIIILIGRKLKKKLKSQPPKQRR
jgi:hypothetical protein